MPIYKVTAPWGIGTPSGMPKVNDLFTVIPNPDAPAGHVPAGTYVFLSREQALTYNDGGELLRLGFTDLQHEDLLNSGFTELEIVALEKITIQNQVEAEYKLQDILTDTFRGVKAQAKIDLVNTRPGYVVPTVVEEIRNSKGEVITVTKSPIDEQGNLILPVTAVRNADGEVVLSKEGKVVTAKRVVKVDADGNLVSINVPTEPVVVTPRKDAEGKIIPEASVPVRPARDSAGNLIPIRDTAGNLITEVDPNGNLVLKRDVNGNLIPLAEPSHLDVLVEDDARVVPIIQ